MRVEIGVGKLQVLNVVSGVHAEISFLVLLVVVAEKPEGQPLHGPVSELVVEEFLSFGDSLLLTNTKGVIDVDSCSDIVHLLALLLVDEQGGVQFGGLEVLTDQLPGLLEVVLTTGVHEPICSSLQLENSGLGKIHLWWRLDIDVSGDDIRL